MDQITRPLRSGRQTFPIYTEEEARAANLKIVPWRQVTVGDWALSDDGYVGECLKVWVLPNGNKLIGLTYGSDWKESNSPMLYAVRAATKNWSYRTREGRQQGEARRTRARNAIFAYVTMLVSTEKVDWAVLGSIYRPDDGIPIAQVRRDFKKRAFKKMIQQELERVLIDQGSSPKRVVEMYNEAFELAARTKKPSIMIDVADRLSELWGLKEVFNHNGELPEGLGSVTILEGVEADIQIAKEASNGK